MDPFKHIPSLIELNISICTPILINTIFKELRPQTSKTIVTKNSETVF